VRQRHTTYVAKLTCVLCLVSCVLIGFFALTGCAPPPDKVCFANRCINIEVVTDSPDLVRGLKFRSRLKLDAGMLFVFSQRDVHKFWMKDTWIPLDMIWLDDEKRIIDIVTNVPPCQDDPCPSYGQNILSRYVLEINAGQAERWKLSIGDEAKFRGSPGSPLYPKTRP